MKGPREYTTVNRVEIITSFLARRECFHGAVNDDPVTLAVLIIGFPEERLVSRAASFAEFLLGKGRRHAEVALCFVEIQSQEGASSSLAKAKLFVAQGRMEFTGGSAGRVRMPLANRVRRSTTP
ncbi:hypothetical protein KM043_011534 [Ampulex compressa]|nr:hypothetical protein KM043_011534 [Ampulex compressa]